MSQIEKLAIRGIRAFSPDREQAIEFESPLTMIVGANGCGKTTVCDGVPVPSLHSHASSPGMMDVGGFFFEFEAIRTRDAPRRESWRSSIGYYVRLRRTR